MKVPFEKFKDPLKFIVSKSRRVGHYINEGINGPNLPIFNTKITKEY